MYSDHYYWWTTLVGTLIVVLLSPLLGILQLVYTATFFWSYIVHRLAIDPLLRFYRARSEPLTQLGKRRHISGKKGSFGYSTLAGSEPTGRPSREPSQQDLADTAQAAIYLGQLQESFVKLDWEPPQPGEQRSPCPAMNIFANHNYLHRHGDRWYAHDVSRALQWVFRLERKLADRLSFIAVYFCGDAATMTFSLGKLKFPAKAYKGAGLCAHAKIEHDASLSRADSAQGDNASYDEAILQANLRILKEHGDPLDGLTPEMFGILRQARWKVSRHQNPFMFFGPKEALLAYGEVALMHHAIAKGGKIDLHDLETWLSDKLPDTFEPPKEEVTLGQVQAGIADLKHRYPPPRRFVVPEHIKYFGVWLIILAHDLLSSQVSIVLDAFLRLAGIYLDPVV